MAIKVKEIKKDSVWAVKIPKRGKDAAEEVVLYGTYRDIKKYIAHRRVILREGNA
ncbi:MAG: hypothetical protein PHE78_08565 [Candidatus Gastranaerophilales bacterium]|nr:hypothetical protein [Candidatus Gastranaerophilales bacterium]